MATSCAFRLYPASPASSGRGPRPKSLISSRIAAICPTVKPSTENVSTKPGRSTVTKALPSLTGADLEQLELSAMGQADAEELAHGDTPASTRSMTSRPTRTTRPSFSTPAGDMMPTSARLSRASA